MFFGKGELSVKAQYALGCALIAVSGIYIFRWIFYPEMTFYVDDWSWLYRSRFEEWTQWSVFPKQAYNDRPIGALIINALYHLFGLNYTAFGIVLLSIHLANGMLLFALASQILRSRFYGAIVGLLFVVNLNVAYQPWWTGTLFDSTSLFFCLCAFLAFLSNATYARILTVLFYFLAVRSKEASLPLPLVLFSYSFCSTITSLKLADIGRSLLVALKRTWPVFLAFGVLLGIFLKYYFAAKAADFGPYAPKFSIWTIYEGIRIYLRYISYDLLSLDNALLAYLALTVVALIIWAPMAVFGSIAFLVAAAPVLVLGTQRVPYYAYIPSPYIAFLLVGILQRFNMMVSSKLGKRGDRTFEIIILVGVLCFVSYIPKLGLYREPLLAIMRENSLAMKTLKATVDHFDENSNVVIAGLPPGPLHLFAHAPCHAIKVIYEVKKLDCHIEGTDSDLLSQYEKLSAPKVLLRYEKGSVTLVTRS